MALTTAVIVTLGAIGIFAVEHGTNQNITSLGDAFWWSIVTVTTVGYGDVSPVTAEGRPIAIVLMVVAVNGPGGDDLKDQQVERALGEIGFVRHPTPRPSTYTALPVEEQGV
jgi:voltage-gated potassium channel Kch